MSRNIRQFLNQVLNLQVLDYFRNDNMNIPKAHYNLTFINDVLKNGDANLNLLDSDYDNDYESDEDSDEESYYIEPNILEVYPVAKTAGGKKFKKKSKISKKNYLKKKE